MEIKWKAFIFEGGILADTLHSPTQEAIGKIDAAHGRLLPVLAASRAEALALFHDWKIGYAARRDVPWGDWTVDVVAPPDAPNAKKRNGR